MSLSMLDNGTHPPCVRRQQGRCRRCNISMMFGKAMRFSDGSGGGPLYCTTCYRSHVESQAPVQFGVRQEWAINAMAEHALALGMFSESQRKRWEAARG